MKIILGLTGGSGSGKSLAADYLQKKGAEIIDADKIAREIIKPGAPALSEVSEAFPGVLRADGSLNRKKLGAIVFSDKDSLHRLNTITHKYIIEEIRHAAEVSKNDFVVIDAPLLLECDLDRLCTACVCILADHPLRVRRIMDRDGLTKQQAEDRIGSQSSDNFYKSRCRYVIHNNKDITSLTASLDAMVKELLS